MQQCGGGESCGRRGKDAGTVVGRDGRRNGEKSVGVSVESKAMQRSMEWRGIGARRSVVRGVRVGCREESESGVVSTWSLGGGENR